MKKVIWTGWKHKISDAVVRIVFRLFHQTSPILHNQPEQHHGQNRLVFVHSPFKTKHMLERQRSVWKAVRKCARGTKLVDRMLLLFIIHIRTQAAGMWQAISDLVL